MLTRRRFGLLAAATAALCWTLGAELASVRAGVPGNQFVAALPGLAFAGAGFVAADRRPGNAIGPLMFGYVFLAYLGGWGTLQVPGLPALGLIGGLLAAPVLAHLTLAYPAGRLAARLDRVAAGVFYAAAASFSVALLLTFDPRAAGCIGCAAEPAVFPSPGGGQGVPAGRPADRTRAGPAVPRRDLVAVAAGHGCRAQGPGTAVGGCPRGGHRLPDVGIRLAGCGRRSVRVPDLGTAGHPDGQRADRRHLGSAVRAAGPQRGRRADHGPGAVAALW